MGPVKTRNFLILIHLYLAAFLAPTFLLVAITGALDHADIKPETTQIPISLPPEVDLNPKDPDLEATLRRLFAATDLDVDFEYVRARPDRITTVPTTRPFVRFLNTDTGWEGTLNVPSLHYALMELHKGHGPAWFNIYQLIAGVALFLVILGGLIVGLMAKAYRRKTVTASLIGSGIFVSLAFLV
ncbi:MAG: hypothetical protein AAGE37_07405 [Pseudomonadota bacterium]